MRPTRGENRLAGVSSSYQAHGINSNGCQIDGQDSEDNYDQEVNDTNTDPVSPIAIGGLAEGVNQR